MRGATRPGAAVCAAPPLRFDSGPGHSPDQRSREVSRHEDPGWHNPDPELPEDESWQPLPDSPSVEQLRESLANTREGLKAALSVIDGLQKQINALDRMLKEHRHGMGGDRGWSAKPEF